jgi:hypothetical protein
MLDRPSGGFADWPPQLDACDLRNEYWMNGCDDGLHGVAFLARDLLSTRLELAPIVP